MAEGKQRFAEYKQDKADGSVNWAQEGKDAMKDWKPQVCAVCSDAKYCKCCNFSWHRLNFPVCQCREAQRLQHLSDLRHSTTAAQRMLLTTVNSVYF